jgi:hypothetical protein
MASRADEIERDIAERRRRLGRRAEDLRWSAEDLRSASKSMLEGTDLGQQVEKHPMLWVAGALGAGVLLGALSEGGKNNGTGGGLRDTAGSTLAGGLIGAVEAAAGDEVRRFIGEALSKLERQPEPVH